MADLIHLIQTHPFWSGVISYWVYSCAVDALPAPNGNKFYQFVYKFTHGLAGILSRSFGSKVPGVQTDEVKQTVTVKTETKTDGPIKG